MKSAWVRETDPKVTLDRVGLVGSKQPLGRGVVESSTVLWACKILDAGMHLDWLTEHHNRASSFGPLRQRRSGDPWPTRPSLQVYDSKSYKSKEPHELVGGSPHREASPMPVAKEAGQGKDVMEEEAPEERETIEATQGRTGRSTRKGEVPISGEWAGCQSSLSPFISVLFSRTSSKNVFEPG